MRELAEVTENKLCNIKIELRQQRSAPPLLLKTVYR